MLVYEFCYKGCLFTKKKRHVGEQFMAVCQLFLDNFLSKCDLWDTFFTVLQPYAVIVLGNLMSLKPHALAAHLLPSCLIPSCHIYSCLIFIIDLHGNSSLVKPEVSHGICERLRPLCRYGHAHYARLNVTDLDWISWYSVVASIRGLYLTIWWYLQHLWGFVNLLIFACLICFRNKTYWEGEGLLLYVWFWNLRQL